ncbi:hypothetical protein LCGC14_1410890 [marine sediment metagenome]|uniref:DNA methylase N-4/N-6 domain-containing protein n=1 Tax=marine sediment metagenome TaxID=412755 RepID=A0A0F9M9Q7_9ZZZZ
MDESNGFAAQYQREQVEEKDLILFPRDIQWRRQLFPQEVFDHPAKANMHLIVELVRYLTEPGDTIIDPFAGTGTLMLALLEGRSVVLIDIEPPFVALLEKAKAMWFDQDPPIDLQGKLTIIQGDCRQAIQDLDFLCDAAIFSPPYSNILSSGGETRTGPSDRITPEVIAAYGGKQASPQNLGRLNPFFFEHSMTRVYQRLHKRLVPNAPMAIISKDAMQAGRRMILSEKIIRQAQRSGFKLAEWHKWLMPFSSYRAPAAAKGIKTVDDEDILIFRREP